MTKAVNKKKVRRNVSRRHLVNENTLGYVTRTIKSFLKWNEHVYVFTAKQTTRKFKLDSHSIKEGVLMKAKDDFRLKITKNLLFSSSKQLVIDLNKVLKFQIFGKILHKT